MLTLAGVAPPMTISDDSPPMGRGGASISIVPLPSLVLAPRVGYTCPPALTACTAPMLVALTLPPTETPPLVLTKEPLVAVMLDMTASFWSVHLVSDCVCPAAFLNVRLVTLPEDWMTCPPV